MSEQSFFLYDMWNEIAKNHKPLLSFRHAGINFEEWHKAAHEKLLELLGDFPEKVELEPVIEYSENQG